MTYKHISILIAMILARKINVKLLGTTCIEHSEELLFFVFELMLNVPVNSYGHLQSLPPFYGTYTQN